MHRLSRSKNLLAIAVAVTISGTAATPSFATSFSDSPKLESYTSSADFVFRGIVEDVQYALSEPVGPEGTRLPYTFVTFRIGSVMKGMPAGPTVTLRFLGGMDSRNGSFMTSDQTPLFDVDDDNILFAKRNGDSVNPLVRNKNGRFRVISDRIYTDDGQEIILGAGNSIRPGKRHAFEEVLTTRVGDRTMKFQSHGKAEASGSPSDAVAVEEFSKAIEQTVAQTGDDLSTVYAGEAPNSFGQAPDMSAVAPPGSR